MNINRRLSRAEKHLRNAGAARGNRPTASRIRSTLRRIKRDAVDCGDESGAKAAWCYETIFAIQDDYCRAFAALKRREFYEAWCQLEQAELALFFLARHFTGNQAIYRLDFIEKQVANFQALFPYRLFFSTGFIINSVYCSICDVRIGLRERCGHEVGEIYDGEYCARVIKDAELLEVSLVEDPVHKYAVPFIVDERTGKQVDHYNYNLVAYVTDGLADAFDDWALEWSTRRQPHSRFSGVAAHDKGCVPTVVEIGWAASADRLIMA